MAQDSGGFDRWVATLLVLMLAALTAAGTAVTITYSARQDFNVQSARDQEVRDGIRASIKDLQDQVKSLREKVYNDHDALTQLKATHSLPVAPAVPAPARPAPPAPDRDKTT